MRLNNLLQRSDLNLLRQLHNKRHSLYWNYLGFPSFNGPLFWRPVSRLKMQVNPFAILALSSLLSRKTRQRDLFKAFKASRVHILNLYRIIFLHNLKYNCVLMRVPNQYRGNSYQIQAIDFTSSSILLICD